MPELPPTNTFCWNELATTDSTRCTQFYTDLFGWTAKPIMAEQHPYTLFQQGDKDLAGMIQMTPEWGNVRPHWMPYVVSKT